MVKNRVGPAKGSQRPRDPFFAKKKQSYESSSSDNTPFFIQSSSQSGADRSGNSESKNEGFFVQSSSKNTRDTKTNAFKSNHGQCSKKNSFEPRNRKFKATAVSRNNKEKHEGNYENRGYFNKLDSVSETDGKAVGAKFKDGKVKKKESDKIGKKAFDKKKWRLQKYSKKYKLEQWEEKRKKAVLREYYKEIKDDKPKMDVQKIYSQYADDDSDDDNENKQSSEKQTHKYVRNAGYVPNDSDLEDIEFTEEPEESTKELEVVSTDHKGNKVKGKTNAFKKARMEFERLKQEKLAKREEYLKKKAEKEEALKEYRRKKNEKYKKLNKKTKRGQPVMKDRIEMLLEKIQSG